MDTTIETEVSAPAAPVESAPTTDIQSTDAPAEGSENLEASKAEEAKRPPTKLQKRIDQLTQQRYEEQRAREAAEMRLAQYERQQQLTQQFAKHESEFPDINRFNDLPSYNRAVAEWASTMAETRANAKWEERLQRMAQENAVQTAHLAEQHRHVMQENHALTEKMGSAVRKYADFHQVVGNPELPSIRGTPAYYAILQADNFADISYALAKNPAELERIASIADPVRAGIEVARLDAKFSGNAATSAPPPPPNRSGSTVINKATSDMSTAEWMAWREGQLKKRRA